MGDLLAQEVGHDDEVGDERAESVHHVRCRGAGRVWNAEEKEPRPGRQEPRIAQESPQVPLVAPGPRVLRGAEEGEDDEHARVEEELDDVDEPVHVKR